MFEQPSVIAKCSIIRNRLSSTNLDGPREHQCLSCLSIFSYVVAKPPIAECGMLHQVLMEWSTVEKVECFISFGCYASPVKRWNAAPVISGMVHL